MAVRGVSGASAGLRQRARDRGAELAAAFAQTRRARGQALAALDARGKVVIADEGASLLLGVPARVPAYDPAVRWQAGLDLGRVRPPRDQAGAPRPRLGRLDADRDRAQQRPCRITLRPVFLGDQPIGTLAVFGFANGDAVEREPPEPAPTPAARIVGVSGEPHGAAAPVRGPLRGGGRQRRLARHRRRPPPGGDARHRQARGGARRRRVPARPPALPRQPHAASARSSAGRRAS